MSDTPSDTDPFAAVITFRDSFGNEYTTEAEALWTTKYKLCLPNCVDPAIPFSTPTLKVSFPQSADVVFTNNGNLPATINSIGNSNSNVFTAELQIYTGASWIAAAPPQTIPRTGKLQIHITSNSYNGASGQLSIYDAKGTLYTINMQNSPQQ